MDYAKRKQEMTRLRHEEGWTIKRIGDKFGVSRERVRQIIGNTGTEALTRWTKKFLEETDLSQKTTREACNLGVRKGMIARHMASIHHAAEGGTVKQGEKGERIVSKILADHGISNTLMPMRYPFDILLDNGIKIDVKYSRVNMHTSAGIKSPQWHFRTRNPEACDFFACLTKKGDVFIIPSKEAPCPDTFICWPTKRPELSKWEANNFDILKDFA